MNNNANRIHVGIGSYVGGGVTVFPIWPEMREVKNFSWKPGNLVVGEVEQGARVSSLEVTNAGTRPHVVIEGDIFEGGWQTRTAAITTVIAPGETVQVPVLCVEQGRWGGERRHSNSRTRRTPYGVRRRMYDNHAKRRGNDQGEVWEEINRMQRERGFNQTGSLAVSLDNFKQETAHETRKVRVLPGQRGVMIGINGRITACEIFGSTTGLNERFEAIIDAARFEASFIGSRETANYKARDFATTVMNTVDFDMFEPSPIEVTTSVGPLAYTNFATPDGLVYATILNQQDLYV